MNDPEDIDRLKFCTGAAHQVPDLSEFECKLIDDISENGERELTPFERHTLDRVKSRFKILTK